MKTSKRTRRSRTADKRSSGLREARCSALWIADEWHVFRKRDPENPMASPWMQWAGPFWTKERATTWKEQQPWPAQMEMMVGRRAIMDTPNVKLTDAGGLEHPN